MRRWTSRQLKTENRVRSFNPQNIKILNKNNSTKGTLKIKHIEDMWEYMEYMHKKIYKNFVLNRNGQHLIDPSKITSNCSG